MATSSLISSSLLPTELPKIHRRNHQLSLFINHNRVEITFKKPTLLHGPSCKASCWGGIAESAAKIPSPFSWIYQDCRDMEF
ncbi:hypothetical protein Patl1_31831 [Pistacia atlantica]|uniref:Uncharacterized protein n=1 Tax=Pistacia atlantica TaxID=434234 RepID=A0ACC1AQ84_9ROSI|nr:hypothetical protein Patl1_31831 [Pistacia atlantica]